MCLEERIQVTEEFRGKFEARISKSLLRACYGGQAETSTNIKIQMTKKGTEMVGEKETGYLKIEQAIKQIREALNDDIRQDETIVGQNQKTTKE